MEVDHVYELVHHLSERCEFDRTAQLKGLGKVAEAVEKLEWVGEGLDRIEGRLNGSWSAEPSTNEGDEGDAWLVLWIAGTRFNNFVGLGIVISTVVSILTLACLLIYAGRMCRRQKLKGLAQVHTRTEWEQMKGMAQANFTLVGALSETVIAVLGLFSGGAGGVYRPPDLEEMLVMMTDPEGLGAGRHFDREAHRRYGLFLTSLYERFTLFDTHVRALARRVESIRYSLFTFMRIHDGLVKGNGIESFRGRALLGRILEELKDMMPVEAWEALRVRLEDYGARDLVKASNVRSGTSSPCGSDSERPGNREEERHKGQHEESNEYDEITDEIGLSGMGGEENSASIEAGGEVRESADEERGDKAGEEPASKSED